jgi:hypothetical protein
MNFAGLHGIVSQKIELFITAAVRTSNYTFQPFLWSNKEKHEDPHSEHRLTGHDMNRFHVQNITTCDQNGIMDISSDYVYDS